MSRVVSSPGDEVGLQGILVITDVVKHRLESVGRDIAVVVAPLPGWPDDVLKALVNTVVSAADWVITLCLESFLIVEVDVGV